MGLLDGWREGKGWMEALTIVVSSTTSVAMFSQVLIQEEFK